MLSLPLLPGPVARCQAARTAVCAASSRALHGLLRSAARADSRLLPAARRDLRASRLRHHAQPPGPQLRHGPAPGYRTARARLAGHPSGAGGGQLHGASAWPVPGGLCFLLYGWPCPGRPIG